MLRPFDLMPKLRPFDLMPKLEIVPTDPLQKILPRLSAGDLVAQALDRYFTFKRVHVGLKLKELQSWLSNKAAGLDSL